MKFTELTVSTTTSAQELVADIMWNYTNYGVAISDVLDVVELLNDRKSTWDYVDDAVLRELNSNVTLVKAYIPLDITDETVKKIAADLDALKKNCAENGIETGSLETVKRIVDGDDWIEIWRKHYRPIELGNVLICPAWIERKPKEGQVEIIIDSNMAFGTGSGILGIAAAKLGAKKVVMTDIDYVAVKSAKHNCEINGVADRCEVDLNNLLDDKNITGDLVLANITADVLLILSESIPSRVKNGGVLIMSGIIKSRVNEVIDRYSAIDFELVQRKDEGEWIALVMKKKGGAEKR